MENIEKLTFAFSIIGIKSFGFCFNKEHRPISTNNYNFFSEFHFRGNNGNTTGDLTVADMVSGKLPRGYGKQFSSLRKLFDLRGQATLTDFQKGDYLFIKAGNNDYSSESKVELKMSLIANLINGETQYLFKDQVLLIHYKKPIELKINW